MQVHRRHSEGWTVEDHTGSDTVLLRCGVGITVADLVRVRGTIPAADAVGTLREAALMARSGDSVQLYNRVIFAPIEKGNDHELTLFWEVGFPYGDLQWLL